MNESENTDRCNVHEARIDSLESQLSSIESKLDDLCEAVGHAPDAARGTPGSGLARTLVEQGQRAEAFAQALSNNTDSRIKLAKVIAAAVTGVVTTIASAYITYLTMGG